MAAIRWLDVGLRGAQPNLRKQEKAWHMPGFLRSGFAGDEGGAQGGGEAFHGEVGILRVQEVRQ